MRFVILVVASSTYFFTIDKAMLGLPSLEVGVNMASAFLILSTAFTVSKSGSPGPHPMHESFMFSVVKNELFKVKMKLAVGSTEDKAETVNH